MSQINFGWSFFAMGQAMTRHAYMFMSRFLKSTTLIYRDEIIHAKFK